MLKKPYILTQKRLKHTIKIGFKKGQKQLNTGRTWFKKGDDNISKKPEIKEKISKAWKGKHHTEETKRKIGEGNKGKKLSEYSKRKISEKNKGRLSKEKNPNWKGGISFEPYSINWTKTLKRSIRERDHYTCQVCEKEPAVYCHHIDYNKLNCNPNNLITLCHSCHSKTNFNRDYWIKYFYEKIYNRGIK